LRRSSFVVTCVPEALTFSISFSFCRAADADEEEDVAAVFAGASLEIALFSYELTNQRVSSSTTYRALFSASFWCSISRYPMYATISTIVIPGVKIGGIPVVAGSETIPTIINTIIACSSGPKCNAPGASGGGGALFLAFSSLTEFGGI
jgi:hypothetical protein